MAPPQRAKRDGSSQSSSRTQSGTRTVSTDRESSSSRESSVSRKSRSSRRDLLEEQISVLNPRPDDEIYPPDVVDKEEVPLHIGDPDETMRPVLGAGVVPEDELELLGDAAQGVHPLGAAGDDALDNEARGIANVPRGPSPVRVCDVRAREVDRLRDDRVDRVAPPARNGLRLRPVTPALGRSQNLSEPELDEFGLPVAPGVRVNSQLHHRREQLSDEEEYEELLSSIIRDKFEIYVVITVVCAGSLI